MTRVAPHYPKGTLSPYNLNIAQLRSPNTIAWWSAAMPGYGHIMLCKYVKGALLIIWEFVVNVNSHFNTAIILTFTGRFDEATAILDEQWVLLYAPVYLYTIWDSRRVAIDLNKYALLADKSWSVSEIPNIAISSLEVNYLDRRRKRSAVFWSLVTPGLGHLYLGRMPSGFYILIWWMTVLYFAHLLPGVHYTFIGDFKQALAVLDPQWVLFLPSMYGFAAYDAYMNCNNYNKLLEQKQSHYLMKVHQSSSFKGKSGHLFAEESHIMNVVAGFKHSMYLELALKELEANGIPREDVYAIPLVEKERPRTNMDIIRGQGYSLLDGTFAWGTVFAVFGVIYGYVLEGGPVLWGLIGLIGGWGFGFLFDLYLHKKGVIKGLRKEGTEVMVVIHCAKEQISHVKSILFEHDTLGLQVLEEVSANSST